MYNLRHTKARVAYEKKYSSLKLNFQKDKTKRKYNSTPSSPQFQKKIQKLEDTQNIKQKIDWHNWVSATGTRAYLLKDPLQDWLKAYSQTFMVTHPEYAELITHALRQDENELEFTPFIMKQGNKF